MPGEPAQQQPIFEQSMQRKSSIASRIEHRLSVSQEQGINDLNFRKSQSEAPLPRRSQALKIQKASQLRFATDFFREHTSSQNIG